MPREAPPLPPHAPARFTTSVHGTIFCDRARHLNRIRAGDELLLIPGPPVDDPPGIWVHLPGGDLVGHLPPEIELWLAPWMLRGGSATATVLKIEGENIPSWRRLLIEVQCAVPA